MAQSLSIRGLIFFEVKNIKGPEVREKIPDFYVKTINNFIQWWRGDADHSMLLHCILSSFFVGIVAGLTWGACLLIYLVDWLDLLSKVDEETSGLVFFGLMFGLPLFAVILTDVVQLFKGRTVAIRSRALTVWFAFCIFCQFSFARAYQLTDLYGVNGAELEFYDHILFSAQTWVSYSLGDWELGPVSKILVVAELWTGIACNALFFAGVIAVALEFDGGGDHTTRKTRRNEDL